MPAVAPPVTIPLVPIVAAPVLLHTPPVVASDKDVVDPEHTLTTPLIGVGVALDVAVVVA